MILALVRLPWQSYLVKSVLLKIVIPWLITAFALYYALKDIEWVSFFEHVRSANISWIALAVFLTFLSYILRSQRWTILFPKKLLDFFSSARVLIIGFFMNNVLPARTGELVRTHLGSKVTGESRALVLATIASERLLDGLTLSLFFVFFSLHAGEEKFSQGLLYVALAFIVATICVLVALAFRTKLLSLAKKAGLLDRKGVSGYATRKAISFMAGLRPLLSFPQIIWILLSSVIIWSVELLVYVSISNAYGASLSLPNAVLFMVTVNFSSLIPSAPGGIGVIEAAGKTVLTSIGLKPELAIALVLTQHVIQYIVVGIPGALAVLTWKGRIREEDSLVSNA